MTAKPTVLVEACVDAIDAALEAERGGAGRIELCGELLQGGVTPSAGLIAAVWERIDIPLFVLVRPRPGDFLYTDDELDVMRRDIEQAKISEADGVVLGLLTADGEVDVERLRPLVELARPMAVTFHRAFDLVPRQDAALEALVELGVARVLTSGGGPTALEGATAIAGLVQLAADRVIIVAGGSIRPDNVAEIVERTGVREVHVRGAGRVVSAMRYRRDGVPIAKAGAGEYEREVASADEIGRVVARVG